MLNLSTLYVEYEVVRELHVGNEHDERAGDTVQRVTGRLAGKF